jgi:acyl-CoA synthetase (AMP-forming)/AMP-acid ligase II
VFFRSASACIGYWRNGRLDPLPDPGGWRETGDIGYRDEAGFVFLCDRKKDMIVTGGENVYSAEVEAVISGHPDVERVAVIAVPSEKWGEEVKAVVIPRQGTAPKSEDIIAFARGSLAGYKLPKSVDFVTEMPVTSVGKIAKRRCRSPRSARSPRMCCGSPIGAASPDRSTEAARMAGGDIRAEGLPARG